MPKPQVKSPPALPRDPNKPRRGMTPEEQLRQQQIMAYMMAILFPLMFYKMPAGLTLYWFATNIFGIIESLIVRRQIAAEKLRRDAEGPRPPKPRRPGFVSALLKRFAAQAEELQKRADEMARNQPNKGRERDK